MITEIKFKNYRSFRDEQIFRFTANSSIKLRDNYFNIENKFGNEKILKSNVLFGINASGKSNLIRLMFSMRKFILHSTDFKSGDLIPDWCYEPYLLDINTKMEPINFSIEFISNDLNKYRYHIIFDKNEIIYEYLGVYNSARISRIFERENSNEFINEPGEAMLDKKIDKSITKNQLYLSKIGNTPNDQIRNIYLYFKDIEVWNCAGNHHIRALFNYVQKKYLDENREDYRKRLNKLISIVDTKISNINVTKKDEKLFDGLPAIEKKIALDNYQYETFGLHKVYNNSESTNEMESFSFDNNESAGTRLIFSLGGLIIDSFESNQPKIVFLDEFNNSLHPELTKFLIELYHNPKVNKNNSQLIIAVHDTSLMDNKIFRKDQIWFTNKNKYGASDLYSLDDFKGEENLRSDIPYEKWYRSGKFSALPKIRKFEFIGEYEDKES